MTSAMSMAAVPLINEKQVLMISPTTSTNALKATILSQGTFDGLQGDLRIDPYGDPRRRRHLIKIKGEQFRRQTVPE
ncbi:MAG: hypothetical protein ACLFUT_11190 [Desulfobacteraceae bacterium]